MSGYLAVNDVLIIVPAFNEERSLPAVLKDLHRGDHPHVVVSDGSTDRTAAVARQCGSRVLNLPLNLGVGGALRAGFRHAVANGYQAVIQIDADGQHPVEAISSLIDTANSSDAHMVIGSRFISEGTTMDVAHTRRLVMRVLAWSASRAAGTTITDASSGFRLIKSPLLEQFAHQFPNNYLGDTYEAVVSAGRAGYRVVQVPAALRPRQHGESTASVSQAVRFTLKGLGVAVMQLHLRLEPFQSDQL